MQKKENTWKIENKTSKLKKNGSKIRGERRNVKKGKNMGKKWTCPFECFLHLFVFVFFACKKKQIEKAKSFFFPLV
jgi:cell division septal protein FtsQ